MEIDRLLRSAMHAHADQLGAPRRAAGLAATARWRARERRNRHRLVGAATVVALAAAGGVGVAAWPQSQDATGEPAVALAPAAVALTPATMELPEFPYTPGWVPDGVADPYVELWGEVEGTLDGEVVVAHPAMVGDPLTPMIQLRIITEQESPEEPGEDVTVRGAPGVLVVESERWQSVTWTDQAGRLVQVGASPRALDRDDLLRYVEELVEQPLPVTLPVSLTTAPAGAEVDVANPYSVRWVLPEGGWFALTLHDPELVDGVRADYRQSPGQPVPEGVAVEVAGQPAELVESEGFGPMLNLQIRPDLMLTISYWPGEQESLLTFAAGIDLTEHATAAPMR